MSGILDILAKLTDGQILRRVGKNLVGVDISALTPAGNWVPDGNNTRDLGVTGTRWRTLFLGTSAVVPTIGPTAAQQHTLPAVTSSTLAVLGAAQTWTGVQTFSAVPRVTGLNDSAGNTALEVAATASAVNGLRLTNSAAGQPVEVYPQGGDTNTVLAISGKGTGALQLRAGNGSTRVSVNNTGIGLNGATPVAQGAHIPNATDGTDVITQLNLLLAYLRLRGDIASS